MSAGKTRGLSFSRSTRLTPRQRRDLEKALEARAAEYAAVRESDPGLSSAMSKPRIEDLIVAKRSGRVAGFIGRRGKKLFSLYVRKGERGKNVATQLFHFVLRDELQRKGKAELELRKLDASAQRIVAHTQEFFHKTPYELSFKVNRKGSQGRRFPTFNVTARKRRVRGK